MLSREGLDNFDVLLTIFSKTRFAVVGSVD